jgi:hypothetical protein
MESFSSLPNECQAMSFVEIVLVSADTAVGVTASIANAEQMA